MKFGDGQLGRWLILVFLCYYTIFYLFGTNHNYDALVAFLLNQKHEIVTECRENSNDKVPVVDLLGQ